MVCSAKRNAVIVKYYLKTSSLKDLGTHYGEIPNDKVSAKLSVL
jgi:hypothetical protein